MKFLLVTALHGPSDWVFPKGHLESRETHKQAAVREVLEETGINSIPIRPLGVIGFRPDAGSQPVICKYYLMRHIGGDNTESIENRAIKWVTYPEACKMIKRVDAQSLLQRAKFHIEKLVEHIKRTGD